MSNQPQLNISLEPHIVSTLRPLLPLLPSTLSEELSSAIKLPSATIPYVTLQAISRWCRSSDGQEKLKYHSPALDLRQYSMIPLLAGATTSPERKFGAYSPQKEPEEVQALLNKERKMITALINALLSIVGSGIATWWAADKTGWKDQWKVLLSLFVAIVVAISEAVLYIIWQSSQNTKLKLKSRGQTVFSMNKKNDGNTSVLATKEASHSSGREVQHTLRLRR